MTKKRKRRPPLEVTPLRKRKRSDYFPSLLSILVI
jgi:hypothetical protein